MSDAKERIPMNDIINTILDKKFKKVGHDGYADSEVDAFLDAICDVVEELQAHMENLKQQLNEEHVAKENLENKLQSALSDLAAANNQVAATRIVTPVAAPAPAPAPAAASADDVTEILVMAQKLKAETLANAQQKADTIIAEARVKAEAQLGDLSAQRDSLQKQVETLKTTAADFRGKITALLELTKEAVEASDL